MLSEDEARNRILDHVGPGPRALVPLDEASGRFLAAPLMARQPWPLFDYSAMDGYAVRAADAAAAGAEFQVEGEQPAGVDRGLEVGEGGAVRIFTGAPIPGGATAVVMQEDTEEAGPGRIRVTGPVEEGEFIRRRAGEICEGQLLAAAGEGVTPSLAALIASQGWGEISVGAAPRVRVVTTGDEVVLPQTGGKLAPGQIYNSNGVMLEALVRGTGGVAEGIHLPDDRDRLRVSFEAALTAADVVVIAGGVSVGERDFVKEVLAEIGVESGFWRVCLKPGKPLLFGHRAGKLVFGLPGNPVSAFVTYHLFVAPALRKWMRAAASRWHPARVACCADGPMKNDGDRPHYLRGVLDRATGRFRPMGLQESHALAGMSRANAMVRVEPGDRVSEGSKCLAVEI